MWFKYNRGIKKLKIDNHFINQSNCILDDQTGYIWISTNNGLFRFEKNNLISSFQKSSDEIYFEYYDYTYGFLSNEFNGDGFPCANVLSDGRITFPSIAGIVCTDPTEFLHSSDYNVSISIDAFVDNNEIWADSAKLIPYDFKRITFEIQSAHYDHEFSKHLYYRLQGYDDQWYLYEEDQTITYTSLRPGKYSLMCKRMIGDGKEVVRNEFAFTVEKPWYQKLWALILFSCGYHIDDLFFIKISIQLSEK